MLRMTNQKVLMYTAAVCFILFISFFFSGIELTQGTSQSEKPLSFVTDGLKFAASNYSISENSKWAYATYVNGTYTIMNVTGFDISSEDSSLSVACVYPSSGEGLWFITLITETASAKLPLCMQTGAKDIDRARDFLKRYQNWTGNSSLQVVKNMLDSVDASKNTTISTNNITLTVASSPFFTSYYWEYTINGTDYRGLGITIAGKYVFFRDDRNLPFLPQKPPETIFTSYYPSLEIVYPDENSTNIPLNTNITLFATRSVGIMQLYLTPEAKIANFTSEPIQYSEQYTYRLAERLQPNTTYTATMLYGQATPADLDSAPMSIKSWSFATGNSIDTSQPSTTSSDQTQNTSPSTETSTPSPFPTIIIYVLAVIAVVATIAVAAFVLKKRNQSK
jgi:hypothetical protein